nr:MAG TPA: hypothetical protein [Caudoviricetes sp.]
MLAAVSACRTYSINASSSFDFPLRRTPVMTLISAAFITSFSLSR